MRYLRQEIITQVSVLKLPVKRDEVIILNSRDECEDFLDNVNTAWRAISRPVAPIGFIDFQNQILKHQVRTQNVSQVRMVHEIAGTRKLLVDLTFRFRYRFEPADFVTEHFKMQDYFFSINKGFVTYPRLVPSGIYVRHMYATREYEPGKTLYGNYEDIEPSDTFYITTISEHERQTYRSVV
jgi:hypothetical protein